MEGRLDTALYERMLIGIYGERQRRSPFNDHFRVKSPTRLESVIVSSSLIVMDLYSIEL